MRHKIFSIVFFCVFFLCCSKNKNQSSRSQWIQEIMDVEQAFNDLAKNEGLAVAFKYYAADDGVIKRRNKIIKGKEDIASFYQETSDPDESLSWRPTFVKVSDSGDLAYTYGDFVFTYIDSMGLEQQNTGIFHTVWERQTDGNWKFVWD